MGTWWPLAVYKIGKANAVDAVIEPRVGGRWYERGLLHPFIDYDEIPEYLNSRDDAMDADGYIHLSQKPGLGSDINFDYINANLVKG